MWYKFDDYQHRNHKFTYAQSSKNAQYVKSILGGKWFSDLIRQRSGNIHSIIRDWKINNIYNHIKINVLAEDFLLLERSTNFSVIIDDIKKNRTYNSARHTLHSAALFARAGLSVSFYNSADVNTKIPDYYIDIEGKIVCVEAKCTETSGKLNKFEIFSEKIKTLFEKHFYKDDLSYKLIMITIKDLNNIPSFDEVIACANSIVSEIVVVGRDEGIADDIIPPDIGDQNLWNVFVFQKFNICVNQRFESGGFSDVRALYILCRKSEKENSRIVKLAKDASDQIKEYSRTQGIAVIKIGSHQDIDKSGVSIFEEFQKGRLTGLGGVVLMTNSVELNEKSAKHIDVICLISNPSSAINLSSIRFKGSDQIFVLTGKSSTTKIMPYNTASINGRVTSRSRGFKLYEFDEIEEVYFSDNAPEHVT